MVLIEREGWRLRGVENLQAFTQNFYLPGGHIRIHRLGRACANATRDAEHVLAAHAVGALKVFFGVWVEYHLYHAFPVAHVKENHAAVVPAAVYPTTQRYRLFDQIFIDQTAVVGSHRCLHDLMSGSHPALEDSLAGDDAGLVSVFVSLVPEPPPCSD